MLFSIRRYAHSHGMWHAAELVANNTVGVRTYASVLFRPVLRAVAADPQAPQHLR